MYEEPTSKHVGGITELTLIAPIKQAYAPQTPVPMTYAERLRYLFRALFGIRKQSFEAGGDDGGGPLAALGVLHGFRFTIVHDRQLLLTVSFDGAWEPYIRLIAEQAGCLIDVILCHCDDYENHATERGFPEFASWVRRHQLAADFLYPNEPGLTVIDRRYLKRIEQLHRENPHTFDREAAKLTIEDTPRPRDPISLLRGIDALWGVSRLFPPLKSEFRDHSHLLKTAQATFLKLPPLGHALERHFSKQLAWYRSEVEEVKGASPHSVSPVNLDEVRGRVQPNILDPVDRRPTHGCLLLFQVDDGAALRKALRDWFGQPHDTEHTVNVGFTYSGLERVVGDQCDLSKLPKEFREGMQARAGLLGDMGPNHPDRWERPRANASDKDRGEVQLSQIDMVVLVQTHIEDLAEDTQRKDHRWSNDHPLRDWVGELEATLKTCAQLLSVEPLRRYAPPSAPYAREHFGYLDGISQPIPVVKQGPLHGDEVPLGEIITGYPNARGERPPRETASLLKDGSFLVVRKLEQDVGAFRRWLDGQAPGVPLTAKIMGRDEDGQPLVPFDSHALSGTVSPNNGFDYRRDTEGAKCPFRAHIRRVNPRDPQRPAPRILRRGFSYGQRYDHDPGDTERGLMFMAYCASLADQFEVLQSWIAGANSTGVLSAYDDVLLGVRRGGPEHCVRILHNGDVHRFELPAKPFVKLKWGLYFFVPSMHLLRNGFELEPSAVAEAFSANSERTGTPAQHDGEKQDPETRRRIFEGQQVYEAKRDKARAAWDEVRKKNGLVKKGPYGTLVASATHVETVLKDEEHFSVREYWRRMERGIGGLWLGKDHEPRESEDKEGKALDERYRKALASAPYAQEAHGANGFLNKITRQEGFHDARAITGVLLAVQPVHPGTERREVDLNLLAGTAIALLIAQRVGFPDGLGNELKTAVTSLFAGSTNNLGAVASMGHGGSLSLSALTGALEKVQDPILRKALKALSGDQITALMSAYLRDGHCVVGMTAPEGKACCPGDAIAVARAPFYPHPTEEEQKNAIDRGTVLKEAVKSFVTEYSRPPLEGDPRLIGVLWRENQKYPPKDAIELTSRQIVGAMQGASVATLQSLRQVVRTWIEEGKLWRLQTSLGTLKPQAEADLTDDGPLMKEIFETMRMNPAPDIVHRTVIKRCKLGKVDLEPGERVLVGLGAAAREKKDPSWNFGGEYRETKHACPGMEWALGMMAGVLWAMLSLEGLRHEGDMTLSFGPVG